MRRRFEGRVRKRVVESPESPSGIHGETDEREGEHHSHFPRRRENGDGGIRSEVWEGTNRHVEFAKSKFPGTGNFRSVPSQQIPQHPSTPASQRIATVTQCHSGSKTRSGVQISHPASQQIDRFADVVCTVMDYRNQQHRAQRELMSSRFGTVMGCNDGRSGGSVTAVGSHSCNKFHQHSGKQSQLSTFRSTQENIVGHGV